MRMKWLGLLTTGLLYLFAACTPGQIGSELSPTQQPNFLQEGEETPMNEEVSVEDPTVEPNPENEVSDQERGEVERRIEATLPAGLERVPTPAAPIVGEVPDDLLAEVIDDLKANQSIGGDAVEVVRAESVVWNDGSLGCPKPGIMYTQALVPGYWIVLQHGEKSYDYRVSDRGTFFRCENASSLPGGEAPSQ